MPLFRQHGGSSNAKTYKVYNTSGLGNDTHLSKLVPQSVRSVNDNGDEWNHPTDSQRES